MYLRRTPFPAPETDADKNREGRAVISSSREKITGGPGSRDILSWNERRPAVKISNYKLTAASPFHLFRDTVLSRERYYSRK